MLTMSPGTSLKSSIDSIMLPSDCFAPFCFSSEATFLGSAIDGVMQIERLQRVLIFRSHIDADFFDRADLGIFARLGDLDSGLADLAGFDEIVVGEAHQFAVIHDGDVISAVLLDRDAGRGQCCPWWRRA